MKNKTFRLFISSTFNDFISERNVLNHDVFPIIDEFCREKGYNFQLIDLRWGVNTESALNHNTLAICLDEVRRCRTLSPRPNFLILAGERYGWTPPPAHIDAQNYRSLTAYASAPERQLLSEWYIPDDNEIGSEYYLRSRTNEYTDDNVWGRKEAELSETFRHCASSAKGDMDAGLLARITSSATEQEILEGFLGGSGSSDNTIAVFRTGYPNRDSDQSRITDLKRRIIEKMQSDGCGDSILELTWSDSAAYRDEFKDAVIHILQSNISAEIIRLEQEAEEKKDETLDQIRETAAILFERDEEMQALQAYVQSDSRKPLFLHGESGCGKTTLLAMFIKQSADDTFYIFYGWNEHSYTLLSALDFLIQRIRSRYEITGNLDINETNISETVYRALYAIPKGKKVVIVIDGFESFHDIQTIKEGVFPAVLPDHVKMIISSADKAALDRFADPGSEKYELGNIDSEKSGQYFTALMRSRNRCLSSDKQMAVVDTLLKTGVTPLQLKLLTLECSGWHSDEYVERLPDSAEAAALQYIADMYTKFGHNKDLVLFALALIAASPYGITENELQTMLLRFDPVRQYFVMEDRYSHQTDVLPFAVWSRLFYDMRECLTLVRIGNDIVVKFEHQIFHRVIVRHYGSYYAEAAAGLIEYYGSQDNYINEAHRPNARKASVLPTLLKQTDQTDRLKELFLDLSFIDAVIRSGRIHEAISDLNLLINASPAEGERSELESLFSCLQRNRIMLSVYVNEFYPCYMNRTVDGTDCMLHSLTDQGDIPTVYFPYSLDSHLKWNSTGTRCAVFNSSYVYVCDAKTNDEICRIYVEPHNENNRIKNIKDIVWLDDNLIAVISYDKAIEIFDIHDGKPNILRTFYVEKEIFDFAYSQNHHIALWQEGKKISAYHIISGELKFTIPLTNSEKVGFEINEETNSLFVHDSYKSLQEYNISSGKKIRQFETGFKYNFLTDTSGISIHSIAKSKWVAYRDYPRYFAVFNTEKGNGVYLHPPMFEKIASTVMGKRCSLFVYTDRIIMLDLTDGYRMKWLYFPQIKDVAWIIKDVSISVLTYNGLYLIDAADFDPLPPECEKCFASSKNLFDSLTLRNKIASPYNHAVLGPMSVIFNVNNLYDYGYYFSYLYTSGDVVTYAEMIRAQNPPASLAVPAADGKSAAVFEEKDALIVYDSHDQPILQIEKLKLALIDNILKVLFSPDSENLLIWRNYNIQIINIKKGRMIYSMDLKWRPAYDVEFTDKDDITVLFCNGERYTIHIRNARNVKIPKKMVSSPRSKAYWGPYDYYYDEGKYHSFNLLDHSIQLEQDNNPYRWFKKRRVYHGREHWLYYKNGTFCLDGDEKKVFTHEFYDFRKCHQLESLTESSPIRMYLHEKNDLFSNLYSVGDHYLVLVTRLLNSIIVFDIANMCVCSAMKFDENIIGCTYWEGERVIDILLDKSPYRRKIKINIG